MRARIEYRGTIERGDAVDAREHGPVVTTTVPELAVWLSVDGDVRVSATVTVPTPPSRGQRHES